ncbi:MAG: hypothetical protein IKF65_00070 [Clostridia bacterium]|nr:hypothetical protein [Clostridia bacterium]
MIWQYFPVGLRFPVRDFSDETKRACWKTALSALLAADANGATLYDAQQTYDAGTGGPVYLCIACFYGVKQSRASSKKLYELDGLMTRLCRSMPFFQANALESFGPYPPLGKLEENGTVSVTEAGEAVLKGVEPERMAPGDGIRLLIASDGNGTDGDAEALTRIFGMEAALHGFKACRTVIADGGFETLRALVGGLNGRCETVSIACENGERKTETIGVLPGPVAVLEAAGRDVKTVGALIQKALDLGYRKIDLAADGCIDPENGGLLSESPDPRLSECKCRLLSAGTGNVLIDALKSIGFAAVSGTETVLNAIRFAQGQNRVDFAILHTFGVEREAVSAALSELNAQKTPTCLITREPVDADRLMRENPVLRGVVTLAETDESARQTAFVREVLPLIAKDVAKAARI